MEIEELNIKLMDEISGWRTVKTMAAQESITVQALYYRIRTGRYHVANFGGIVVVKPKSASRLRRPKLRRRGEIDKVRLSQVG